VGNVPHATSKNFCTSQKLFLYPFNSVRDSILHYQYHLLVGHLEIWFLKNHITTQDGLPSFNALLLVLSALHVLKRFPYFVLRPLNVFWTPRFRLKHHMSNMVLLRHGVNSIWSIRIPHQMYQFQFKNLQFQFCLLLTLYFFWPWVGTPSTYSE